MFKSKNCKNILSDKQMLKSKNCNRAVKCLIAKKW